MSSPTLSDRTEILMTDLKLDQVGLAKYAEVTKGAVNQWIKSKPTATMNPAVAYRIADKSSYNPRWLILGEGNKKISTQADLTKDEQTVLNGFRLLGDEMRESWLDQAQKKINLINSTKNEAA